MKNSLCVIMEGILMCAVAIGADDSPVTVSRTGDARRNVIVWMDHRAVHQAEHINSFNSPVLRFAGGALSPEMQPPKVHGFFPFLFLIPGLLPVVVVLLCLPQVGLTDHRQTDEVVLLLLQLLWVKENLKESWAVAFRWMDLSDWLTYRYYSCLFSFFSHFYKYFVWLLSSSSSWVSFFWSSQSDSFGFVELASMIFSQDQLAVLGCFPLLPV